MIQTSRQAEDHDAVTEASRRSRRGRICSQRSYLVPCPAYPFPRALFLLLFEEIHTRLLNPRGARLPCQSGPGSTSITCIFNLLCLLINPPCFASAAANNRSRYSPSSSSTSLVTYAPEVVAERSTWTMIRAVDSLSTVPVFRRWGSLVVIKSLSLLWCRLPCVGDASDVD